MHDDPSGSPSRVKQAEPLNSPVSYGHGSRQLNSSEEAVSPLGGEQCFEIFSIRLSISDRWL
jgi:hypothetical protein